MPPSESLLFNLVVCLTAALACGYAALRFRFSPIVGYLVAGVICGPFTAGFVVHPKMAEELADIGVVLLMFGVGLSFNLHELWAVRRVALPGAVGQSLFTTLAVLTVSRLMGLSWSQGLIVGLAFSVASTAVLARMITDHQQLTTAGGRIAIGWTVVEDIFTVVILIGLPMLTVSHSSGGGSALGTDLGLAMGKAALLALLLGVLGLRFVPWLLRAFAGSREMFNLAVPVVALGIAWIAAEFFGVSLALGSFLAGVVAGRSGLGGRIEATLGPLRDLFAALFFLSIGTLLDPRYAVSHPFGLLLALAVVVLVKPVVTLVMMRVLGQPLHAALVVSIGLAQVGEFSFILIRQANALHLLPGDSGHQLVSAAIVSITLNTFLFANLSRIERQLRRIRRLRFA